MASPRRGLDSELERQHRQYAPEMLQQWACQDLKFERDEEYSLSQIQAYEAQPSQQSARVRDEYKLYNNDNNELPNTWMHDSQICLQAIPWRPSHPMQGTHDRRNPPLAYHSDTFGLNTTMADVATPPDLPAYADPKPQQFPTIESSYTDLVTGASAYPFYQTTSDGLPGPGGDDRLFPYTEESGHHLMCAGREGPLPSMEPDPDPEDVRMDVDEDTKDDEVDSPRSKDPSDENKEPPYAKLIWQAFMSTPSRSMHLQQIYEWFRQNTDKADGSGTGWMNSIRHNLSMNKVRSFFCFFVPGYSTSLSGTTWQYYSPKEREWRPKKKFTTANTWGLARIRRLLSSKIPNQRSSTATAACPWTQTPESTAENPPSGSSTPSSTAESRAPRGTAGPTASTVRGAPPAAEEDVARAPGLRVLKLVPVELVVVPGLWALLFAAAAVGPKGAAAAAVPFLLRRVQGPRQVGGAGMSLRLTGNETVPPRSSSSSSSSNPWPPWRQPGMCHTTTTGSTTPQQQQQPCTQSAIPSS